jgi:hypothetical protein
MQMNKLCVFKKEKGKRKNKFILSERWGLSSGACLWPLHDINIPYATLGQMHQVPEPMFWYEK